MFFLTSEYFTSSRPPVNMKMCTLVQHKPVWPKVFLETGPEIGSSGPVDLFSRVGCGPGTNIDRSPEIMPASSGMFAIRATGDHQFISQISSAPFVDQEQIRKNSWVNPSYGYSG